MTFVSFRRAVAGCVGLLLFAATGDAEAQSGRGFLFEEPDFIIGVRGGVGLASAGSDVFDFSREQLTLDRSDFHGFSISGDLGARLGSHVDLIGSVGYIGRVASSESRRFEGTDDLPILQRTEFRRVPLTAGLRLYPLSTGRRIGSYAWVPRQWTPYVGAAAGGMWYRFRQTGEFVDENTLDIFPDELASSGWAPVAEGFAGVEYSLSPRMALVAEGRYSWANAELSRSFDGFEPIDLSGLAVTVGLSIRN